MSDFAEWRPCSSCGSRLTSEEADEGTLCSECMWADEMAFLEVAYAADLDERATSSDAPQEAPQEHERQPGYGWAGIFM